MMCDNSDIASQMWESWNKIQALMETWGIFSYGLENT